LTLKLWKIITWPFAL